MTPTFLGREPVAWTTAIRLTLLAAIAFGLPLTDLQLVAIIAAIEAILFLVTRRQVTPNTNVVERTEARDSTVVAGPANDQVIQGQFVRRLGETAAEAGGTQSEDYIGRPRPDR